MIKLNKITYIFLTSLLFWPLLSYITFGKLGLRNISFYYIMPTILYGLFFIFHNKKINKSIEVPKELYYYLFFIIFLFLWSFFNGEMARRGIIPVFFNNPHIASFFILLIIYNTRFSEHFIDRSILILKITIVFATFISVIQVFDTEFLNAQSLYRGKEDLIESGLYSLRRTSIFGYINQNSIGLSFIPIIAIVSGVLLYNKKKIYLVYLLLGGLAAFLSNGRYVMISFIIIISQVLLFSKESVKGILRYTAIVTALLLSLYMIFDYLQYDFMKWYSIRLFAEGSIEQTTRYKAIGNFLIFFPKYFFVGNGEILAKDVVTASRAVGSSHIHIGYLSHLVAYGIVGCFFLFRFWFLLAKRLYCTAKQTNYWGSFFAFLTFLWAFMTFSSSSLFFYGLIFAFIFDKYFKDSHSIRNKNIRLSRDNKFIGTRYINNKQIRSLVE